MQHLLESKALPLTLIATLFACSEAPLDTATVDKGWLRGDLHGHTIHSDGEESVETVFRIADSWRDASWLERNPGYEDDHLHFYAITDHRTVSGLEDPGFGHDYLIPIPGEEWGGPMHACIWGLDTVVLHQPQGEESEVERVADSIAEAHAQGALFSLNHPMRTQLWSVEVSGFDAIEVWNTVWSATSPEIDLVSLDERVEHYGSENPAVRAAVSHTGGGNNEQALRFWQTWLSLGVHVPPVGGGDRHMVFPPGMPTTYVRADSRDLAGVMDGLRTGEVFISSSPQGPQVMMEAKVDGERYPMGAALPSGTTEVEVRWRVMRAEGGLLRLVEGVVDPALPDPTETVVELASADEEGSYLWHPPAAGGWLHAFVVEPLPEDFPEWFAESRESLLTFPEADAGDEGALVAKMLSDLSPAIDFGPLLSPEECDPSSWEPWMTWCMPVDQEGMGSFYIPLELQPYLSVEFRDHEPTGYAVGAISAAFHTQ